MRKHEDEALLFIERLRQVYQEKGYVFFDKGDYNLNIVGVRNMTTGKADRFDDWICLVYKIDGKWVVAKKKNDLTPACTAFRGVRSFSLRIYLKAMVEVLAKRDRPAFWSHWSQGEYHR